MQQAEQESIVPGGAFQERHVDADGSRVRCWEAGRGEPLLWLHGAGGPRLSRALDLLAESRRVIAIELSGLDDSAASMASRVAAAAAALGVERCAVLGTAGGGVVALWLALTHPELVATLVLEAPDHDEALMARLGEIQAPTLALYGSRDGVTPPELGRVYPTDVSGGHFVIVYDAGHDIQADRPEAFAEVVGDFVARGPAFLVNDRPSALYP
ncbi:MAG TPA: alpha/beta fold hydrolase [Candidatus Dormibacteraeota bacterium]|jgi:pimeloyl-ACP methyl ester carboxylesterase